MSVSIFNKKFFSVTIFWAVCSVALKAAEAAPKTEANSIGPFSSGLFIIMLSVSILLTLGIIAMAEVVKAGASTRNLRDKKEKKSKDVLKTIALLLMLSFCGSLNAQESVAVVAEPPFDYWGMGPTVFYSMLGLISVQALIFYVLYRTGMSLLRNENVVKKKRGWFFESAVVKSITEATAPEEQAALMMDHE